MIPNATPASSRRLVDKCRLALKVQVCINYLTEYFVDVAELFQGMRGRRKE